MADLPANEHGAIAEALTLLEVDSLVLGVHDPAFPGVPGEDIGRGSPYSRGAAAFLEWARGQGFTGVQLGPQGLTSESNPSPYDGTVFSRNPLNVDLRPLVDEGLLDAAVLQRLVSQRPPDGDRRVSYAHVFGAQHQALADAFERYRRVPAPLRPQLLAFQQENEEWLVPDALFEVLCEEHRTALIDQWPALDRQLWQPISGREETARARLEELRSRRGLYLERYAFDQLLVHRQHEALRARCAKLGLKLFGDLQAGLSLRDVWRNRALLLEGYAMGAPPSRTNPEGQPWNYAVLDPAQYTSVDGGRGPVRELVTRRMTKMLSELDGVRIDHPHGLVCPWVYRQDEPDALRAVQTGARLFSSPNLADHPRLARYSLVQPEQIDDAVPRYADERVRSLSEEQVARYSVLFDEIVDAAQRNGRDPRDLVCEVLSTLPYPLRRVLERHGLGRFRVLQKADLARAGDVYRSENARPPDWIMLGNHDTPSIWQRVREWKSSGALSTWSSYLASHLAQGAKREELSRQLAREPRLLVQAMLADAFTSPARHVFVFFSDLFGLEEPYNVPGTISERNWSLRVPPRFSEELALSPRRALAMALRSKPDLARARPELLTALENN
ncbi:MAG: 4-alpha-glucanotransferase [Myxococcota bacterium]